MVDPKDINHVFSEFIRKGMERNRLNQSELARRTGVSQERISRIVNEESRISLQDFVMLCSVLDVDFTKELMSKMGKIGYIMLPKLSENLYFPLISQAQVMQSLPCYELRSHLLWFASPSVKNWPTPKSTRTVRIVESLHDLHKFIGIRPASSVAANCNTDCHFVPIQRQLVEAPGAQRLC